MKEKKSPAVKIPRDGPVESATQDIVNGITILSIPTSAMARPMVNNPITSTINIIVEKSLPIKIIILDGKSTKKYKKVTVIKINELF